MNEHYPDMEYEGVGVGVRRVGLTQSRHSRGGRGSAGAGVVPASPPAAAAARRETAPAAAAAGRGGRSGDGGEPAARARQQDGPPRGGEREGRPRTNRRLHYCSATTTSSCYDLLNYGSVVGN